MEITLGSKLDGKNYFLNFIRFIAALCVIIAHGQAIAGIGIYDPLYLLTDGRYNIGAFSVAIFFISSGLLVTKSLLTKRDIKLYIKARVLRLFPALIISVILTIIILGLFFSEYNAISFFTNYSTYFYLLNCILIPYHFLPGIFVNNHYNSVVNGSLWTLPIEFVCYIGLLIAFKLNLIKQKLLNVLCVLFAVILVLINYSDIMFFDSIRYYIYPLYMFFVGMVFYCNRDRIVLNKYCTLIGILIFFIAMICGFIDLAMIFIFPYVFISGVFMVSKFPKSLGKCGNYSYEVYLVAFPIQQAITYLYGGEMSTLLNIVIAIPLSIIFGGVVKYISDSFTNKFMRG